MNRDEELENLNEMVKERLKMKEIEEVSELTDRLKLEEYEAIGSIDIITVKDINLILRALKFYYENQSFPK